MNGRRISELFDRWQSVNPPYLTDAELKELRDGMRVIFDFMSASKLSPLTVYYGMQLEAIERMIVARKEK